MTQPEKIRAAHARLETALGCSEIEPAAFVGLDGFVDEIARVVDQRTDFRTFTPVRTIADYARRLAGAAGKSTNVELVIQEIKMGGNGPLMADALGRLGVRVNTAGALGRDALHPVFERLREYGRVISLADPAVTIAAEFDDGKIMHGKLGTLSDVTPENLVAAAGGEAALAGLLAGADLVALVNWTMIPHLTACYRAVHERIARLGRGKAPRFAFFDLCDPQKRAREDLRVAVAEIAGFERAGSRAILGLNEKESAEVCDALGIDPGGGGTEAMLDRARRIASASGVAEVMIHPRTFAVATAPEGDGTSEGPYCEAPRLTTGAGDHFNAGYCFARTLGIEPAHALVVGKAMSGFYVRNGRGPDRDELLAFFPRWAAGRVDE